MRPYYFLLLLAVPFLFSCDKTTEIYSSDSISDYVSLQPGKYITYRVDSTIFKNFGTTVEVHSYQEKNVVDAQITDALGRPGFRIFRYLRDVAGTQPWVPMDSYFITPLSKTLEVSENNLRYVKLALPVTKNYTWKGNNYLPSNPYFTAYGFNNSNLTDWDYNYTDVAGSTTINGQTFNNVIVVQSMADSANVGVNTTILSPTGLGYKTVSVENYAKGLGLIYQNFILWDYQPGPPGHYEGFAVKRTIIDHN